MIRECKHPTCGATCRRPKKEKRFHPGAGMKKATEINHKAVSLQMLLKIAQDLKNTLVRHRDQNSGCISCQNGKVKHAGHFHPQGKFSGVRFDDMNINGQCDWCNTGMEGNLAEYHAGMIARYGAEAVKELEDRANATKSYRWSRSEVMELIQDFKSQLEKIK